MTLLQRAIEDFVKTSRGLADLEEPLNRAAQMVLRCLTSGHKVLTCGNGGSAWTPRIWPQNFFAALWKIAGRIRPFRSPPTAGS